LGSRIVLTAVVAALVVALCVPATADTPPTKEQALALARAINLRAADLPGWRAAPNTNTPADQREEDRLNRCAGTVPNSRAIAHLSSPDLSRTTRSYYRDAVSEVTVMPTVALANQDLAAAQTKRARRCIAKFLSKMPPDPNVKVVGTSVQSLPAPTRHGLGLRIRIRLRLSGQPTVMYGDVFAFVRGRVEVALTTFSFPRLFPAAKERQLVRLLVKRQRNSVRSTRKPSAAVSFLPSSVARAL
jgi:hypothetical protein